jgi:hypothetical protein
VIDPEFRDYLPPQRPEEAEALRLKIELEGCKPGSLTLANIEGKHILIDGHHTYDICQVLGLPLCEPIIINLPNRELAKQWIRDNQLARRNLPDKFWTQYVGEEFNARKRPHGDPARFSDGPRRHCDALEKTAEKLAEVHNTSPRTVQRAGEFAEKVNTLADGDPAVKQAILTGGISKKEVVAATDVSQLFCRDCRKFGPKKDCPKCKAFRKAKAKPPREPGVEEPTKRVGSNNGRPIFDDRKITAAVNALARMFNDRANALSEQKSPHYAEVRKAMNSVLEAWRVWQGAREVRRT